MRPQRLGNTQGCRVPFGLLWELLKPRNTHLHDLRVLVERVHVAVLEIVTVDLKVVLPVKPMNLGFFVREEVNLFPAFTLSSSLTYVQCVLGLSMMQAVKHMQSV